LSQKYLSEVFTELRMLLQPGFKFASPPCYLQITKYFRKITNYKNKEAQLPAFASGFAFTSNVNLHSAYFMSQCIGHVQL